MLGAFEDLEKLHVHKLVKLVLGSELIAHGLQHYGAIARLEAARVSAPKACDPPSLRFGEARALKRREGRWPVEREQQHLTRGRVHKVHTVHVREGGELVHAPQAAKIAGRDQAHELIAACENAREGGDARRGLVGATLVNAGLVDPDGGSRERPRRHRGWHEPEETEQCAQ
eukprot:scaffold37705_cov74-Phaeocystis_antarctica.AAC.5